jgi:hypothetical protein
MCTHVDPYKFSTVHPPSDGDVEQKKFRIGDDLGVVFDQYLGREELEELILQGKNVFDNDNLTD